MSEDFFVARSSAIVRRPPFGQPPYRSCSVNLASVSRLVLPVLLFHFIHISALVKADDLVALAALYNSTNGPHWSSNCRWPATGTPTCTSPGVTCSSGRVTQVNLFYCNITGTLPHQWSSMSALLYMRLYSNRLTGTLPHQWSSMSALLSIGLDSNVLIGTLPHQWSSMSALLSIGLDSNRLTGTLPHQWSSMSALLFMLLDSNHLTGTLPHQWSSMSALQVMYLHSNQLCGTIPAQWQTLPAATYSSSSMDLRNNSLTLPPAAWYTVGAYGLSVVVSPSKPAELCPVSFSMTHSQSAAPTSSLSTLSRSLTATPTGRATSSTTLSLHCDVQLCGLAVPRVSPGGPPHVPLLPVVAGVAFMRAAPVAFAAARDAAVLALRIVCGDYPLPLGLRHAVLLHSGGVLDSQQIGADEIMLFMPNLTLDGPGWLPAGALPFRTTNTIRIGLTVSCGGDAAMVVTVPVMPEPLPALASATAAVSGAAQWVSVAGGAGAAGSVGRAAAAQRLQLCSGVGASYGGLLGVSIGGVGDAEHSYARGAVVGNVGVLAGAAAALLCLALLYGAATGSDCRSSLLRVALPSSLLPVWVATLPTTAAAMPLLVDGDIGFLLLGVASASLPMLLLLAVQVAAHSGRLVVDRVLRTEQQRDCTCVAVLTLLRRSLVRRWRWEDAASVPPAPSTLLRAARVVLLDHRVLWYPALDAGVLTATCVLGVVSGMGDVHLCRRAGWAMLALCAMQLCVCVAVRPMASLASNVHCASCLLLTCAALLVQCIGLSGGKSLPPAATTAAVVLQLGVVGLSLVKLLDDLWNVARSVVRLFAEVALCTRPSRNDTARDSEPQVTADVDEVAEPHDDDLELFDWQHFEEGRSPEVESCAPEEESLLPRRLMLYEELANLEGGNDGDCSLGVN